MSVLLESGMKLADRFFEVVLRFIPDRGKAMEASVELAKVFGDVIKAEVSSSGFFAQWRGMIFVAWGYAIAYRYAIGSLDLMDNMSDRAICGVLVLAIMGYNLTVESIKNVFTLFGKPKKEDGK